MWRILPALVLVAIAMPLLRAPSPALACSGPSPNYAAKSDVIVGGRVTGWAIADDPEMTSPWDTIPIALSFEVEDSIKGRLSPRIEIIDRSSLDRSPDGQDWDYIHWPCGGSGGFHEDPTGEYLIMGLSRNGDDYERGHIFYRAEILDKEQALEVVTQIAQDPYGDPSLTLTVIMSMVPAFLVWLWLLHWLGAWEPRQRRPTAGSCFAGWLWLAASQRRP